jgi:hypothetical protein
MVHYNKTLPHIYMLTLLKDTESFKAGTKYIGQCISGNKNYFTGGIIPKQLIRKYGRNIFKREVIVQDEFEAEELNWLEQFYIKVYATYTRGLNLNPGGGAGRLIVKPVYQYSLDGIFLREFVSAENAARYFNVSRRSIQQACRESLYSGGEVAGFQWRYTKSEVVKPYQKSTYSVYQYEKTGEYLGAFSSPIEAARALNVNNANLHKSIASDGEVSAGGYRFTKIKYPALTPFPQAGYKPRYKLIYQYDLFGNFIIGFSSVKEAASTCGNKAKRSKIKEAEDNARKSAYGFQWRSYKVENCGHYVGGKGKWERQTSKKLEQV